MKNIINRIKSIIKEHYWIIILSFLLTVLIFVPLFVFPFVIAKDYQGININWFGTDAHFYLTRGKEVLEGHSLGSPVLREGKNDADMYLSYSEYILLAPIKLLGLGQKVNIVTLYNVYNFIGVFFLIILIYSLTWQLSRNKLLSLTAALFTVGGYSIVYNKTLFYDNFNIYARVIYPYISSLLLFIYFNLLVKSLKSDELKYKIFSGLAFGLMFYVYFYCWSFMLVLNGCLFLIYLLRKNYSAAKKVVFISLLGLALGLYNLIRLFANLFSDSEIDKQIAYFVWLSYGRALIFSKIGFASLILFLVFWYKRRDDKNSPLFIAVILTSWITLNQQIITGRMLQYGHYYWYFIVPLSIVIGFYMVWRLINNNNLRKYLFIFIIALVFLNTAVGQYKSFFTTLELKRYEQNFRPLVDYLNRDPNPGVIFADQANNYLFTIYTAHDIFWNQIVTLSHAPLQRFKDTLFIYYYLNKKSRNNFSDYLTKIGADTRARGAYYVILFRNLEGLWSGYDFYAYQRRIVASDRELAARRPEIIARLSREYSEAVKDGGINQILEKYGVNYFVWDKNKNPEWDLSGLSGLEEVISNNNIYLYKINQ